MRRTCFAAAASAAALMLGGEGLAQSAHSLAEDAAAFGAREGAMVADISPDGRSIVYITPAPAGGSVAITADLVTREVKPFLRSARGAERLNWCAFVTDERLICRYSRIVDDPRGLIGFTRLIAIDRDGSNIKQLGQVPSYFDAGLRQSDGEIIDWDPGRGGSILMARQYVPEEGRLGTRLARSKDGYGVDRIDSRSLRITSVEPPKRLVSGYMSDGRGNVRLMAMAEVSGEMLTGRTRYFYRAQGSRDWKPLTEYVDEDAFTPLAVDATTDALYALKPLNGRQALYRLRLTNPASEELAASHPRVDIQDVTRSSNGQRVIGYTFVDDKRETIYFDPEYKEIAAALRKALPKLPLVNFAGASADGSTILLIASADNDPGRYFVFDKGAKQLSEVMLARPELEKRTLAAVKPVQVREAMGCRSRRI